MNLIEKINKISEEAKNKFKPDLKKYGKNFRAISESAVLEVLNPLFSKYNIAYEVLIRKCELRTEKIKAGIDTAGNLIEKLVFVADVVVELVFREKSDIEQGEYFIPGDITLHSLSFQGWGSGVDAGDKATGKALTAAVKYALFKGLRLQYSDDPDADASEDIESIIEKKSPEKILGDTKKKTSKTEEKEEPLASEGQLNYIRGMAKDYGFTDEDFKEKFGIFPYDSKISMRKAREIIDKLKNWTPFD